MDGRPLLVAVARALHEQKLEAVLIGNAAAALQGAPVTTVQFAFLFRKNPPNVRKLKAVAKTLRATLFKQYYPAADLFRIMRDEDSLKVLFKPHVGRWPTGALRVATVLAMDEAGGGSRNPGTADALSARAIRHE